MYPKILLLKVSRPTSITNAFMAFKERFLERDSYSSLFSHKTETEPPKPGALNSRAGMVAPPTSRSSADSPLLHSLALVLSLSSFSGLLPPPHSFALPAELFWRCDLY